MPTREQARAVTNRITADPVWFAENILGHDVWSVPRAVMRAIAQPRARVAVKSCHASSKTFTAAELVLWAPFAGGIAITTAPTDQQVRRLVWAEARTMHPLAKVPLGGEILQTEFRIAPDLYAIGRATDKGVNFQGFHAREGGFMLVVLDEGPGVTPGVYAAIEGARAGGDVRILLLGNPDVPSGPFYDAFTKDRSGFATFTIDGFATPNLRDLYPSGVDPATLPDAEAMAPLLAMVDDQLDAAERPYLITRRYVVEKWREWGERSPLWQSKVRGRFPDQSEDSLISLAWLDQAKRNEREPVKDDPWEAGIDVAGPGEDETVLSVRHGPRIELLRAWATSDPRGDVLAALEPFAKQIERIKVDTIGQGYYFARHLEDAGFGEKVEHVNVGAEPRDSERYANLKAELYWGLRQRLRDGDLTNLADDLAVSQLASLRYVHNPRGQVVIESKEQARKRGVKSPDRAEALMLCFADTAGRVERAASLW